jgi:putative transposase
MILKELQDSHPLSSISSVCSCLGINRSNYYRWKALPTQPPSVGPYEMKLKNEIQSIALEFPKYGYRRVTFELRRRDFPVNAKHILRLMREDNLLCVRRTFRPVTTNSNHSHKIYPNLAKDLNITGLNQLWVADITYIRLLHEFIYLAVIIDVFSRKCIGWELGRNVDTQLTLNALHRALNNRCDYDLSNLVHHSDQGVQYASQDYIDCLKEHEITVSMSRKGNPYDNAFAESFIKTLKYEEVYLTEYRFFEEAYENIEHFIERVYNEKRLHSSIGYLPPNEFEEAIAL